MAWDLPKPTRASSNNSPSDEQFPSLGAPPLSSRIGVTQCAAPAKQTKQLTSSDTFFLREESQQPLGYHVTGSKKGGFPVTVEKRSCGKKVTVIRNVTGDSSALLSGMKKKLGCGGVINKDNGNIEIQGERQAAVETYLTEMNCLKSVSMAKQVAAAPVKKEGNKVAELTNIDKKMMSQKTSSAIAPAELSSITEQAAKKMKPSEIKVHLKAAGLSTQGNKKELLARLLEQIKH